MPMYTILSICIFPIYLRVRTERSYNHNGLESLEALQFVFTLPIVHSGLMEPQAVIEQEVHTSG